MIMKTLKEMWSLWKQDVSWDKRSRKEKKICFQFAYLVSMIMLFSNSWVAIPAIVFVVYTSKELFKLEIEE